jgi:hypothetical protein
MWFSSLMRNPKRFALVQRRRTPAPSPKRSTFRPQLEALEDRWVPTLFSELSIVYGNLNISGLGAGNLTISGNGQTRIFHVWVNANVTLAGMTITNGVASISGGSLFDPYLGDGGAILNTGTLTVNNCTITHNSASIYGGGIANFGGLAMNGCTVSQNHAYEGGGLYNDNPGAATVSGCAITYNHAYKGGGIYNNGSYLHILWSTVENNTADSGSGNNIYGPYFGQHNHIGK